MGLFDSLFGKKKTTWEDADKINDAFIAKNPIAKNKENEMMRTASKLMTSGKFRDSLEIYKKLADEYPANKGLYESQVGVAYYFLEDYEKAIELYVSAMNNGADKGMIDDNVFEAAETWYNKKHDKSKLEYYMSLFANGRNKKKAEKLIQG